IGILSAQIVALMTALIALLAFIGYAYIALALIGIEQFIPMALNSAMALALTSAGILCAHPDRGLMAVVSSPGAGGVMARRLLPAMILISAVVGWLRWLALREGLLDQVMGLSLFVVANRYPHVASLVERGVAGAHGPRAASDGASARGPVRGDAGPR